MYMCDIISSQCVHLILFPLAALSSPFPRRDYISSLHPEVIRISEATMKFGYSGILPLWMCLTLNVQRGNSEDEKGPSDY